MQYKQTIYEEDGGYQKPKVFPEYEMEEPVWDSKSTTPSFSMPTPPQKAEIPGAGWVERRLTDVANGLDYAKYLADKNKVSRWLFDTRDIAVDKGPNWEDFSLPTSKLPDSLLENLAEWVPNPITSILTNADDFANSNSKSDTLLEASASLHPYSRKLGVVSKSPMDKALKGSAITDYAVDSYQDNLAGMNPDIKREKGADAFSPWGVYETEQLKQNTKPVEKPKFREYRPSRTVHF